MGARVLVAAGADVDPAALVGGARVAAGADVAAAALVGGTRVGAGVDVAAEQARLAITNTPTAVASRCDRDIDSSFIWQNDTLR